MLSFTLLRLLYITLTGGLSPYLKFLPLILSSTSSLTSDSDDDGGASFSPQIVGLILLSTNILNFISSTFIWGPLSDHITQKIKTSTSPSDELIVKHLQHKYIILSILPNLLITSVLYLIYTFKPDYITSYVLLPLISLLSLTSVGSSTLLETFSILKTSTQSSEHSYGSLRLYGAAGWGIFSYLSGLYVDRFTDDSTVALSNVMWLNFNVTSLISILFTVLDKICAIPEGEGEECAQERRKIEKRLNAPLLSMIEECDYEDRETTLSSRNSLLDELQEDAYLLNNETKEIDKPSIFNIFEPHESHRFWLLITNLFVTGLHVSYVEFYLFTYIPSEYPSCTAEFLGSLVLVMVVFEVPVFIYSKKIIEKLGIHGTFTLSHFFYCTRVWCYTIVPDDQLYWFWVLEPSHAFVFAGMMCAAVEAGRTLGGGDETKQGVVQSWIRGVYYFLGLGVGGVVGGCLIENYGYHFMYRFGAVTLFCWSVIYNILYRIIEKPPRSPPPQEN